MTDQQSLKHISLALAAAVPLAIDDLERQGGPGAGDHIVLDDWARMNEEDPDMVLLLRYGPGAMKRKQGDTTKVFALLTRVIAVASFSPGGIHIFGSHFVGGEDNRQRTAAVYALAESRQQ